MRFLSRVSKLGCTGILTRAIALLFALVSSLPAIAGVNVATSTPQKSAADTEIGDRFIVRFRDLNGDPAAKAGATQPLTLFNPVKHMRGIKLISAAEPLRQKLEHRLLGRDSAGAYSLG